MSDDTVRLATTVSALATAYTHGEREGEQSEPANPPLDRLTRSATTDEGGSEGDDSDHRLHGPSLQSRSSASPSSPSPSSSPSSARGDSDGYRYGHRVHPENRDRSLIAPPSMRDGVNADPLRGWCGCGECDDGQQPAACPNPRVATIAEARETYRKLVGTRYNSGQQSKVDAARDRYERIMAADRHLRRVYDSPSVVLISLRPSPLDGRDRVVTPLGVDRALHAGYEEINPRRATEKVVCDCEFITVVAGTRHWGTPHAHVLIYADDPDDDLDGEAFAPMIETFVENCSLADPLYHLVDDSGDAGTVRVEHTPLIADDTAYRGKTPPSQAAVYVATQLPHWALVPPDGESEYYEPRPADVEAAVTAWASPNQWFSTTKGVSAIVRETRE